MSVLTVLTVQGGKGGGSAAKMDVNYAVRQAKIASKILDKPRQGGWIRGAAAWVIQKCDAFLEGSCHGRGFDRIRFSINILTTKIIGV